MISPLAVTFMSCITILFGVIGIFYYFKMQGPAIGDDTLDLELKIRANEKQLKKVKLFTILMIFSLFLMLVLSIPMVIS